MALQQFIAEPLLSRVIERLRFYEDNGITIGEDNYDIHILDIEVENTSATVTSCNLDAVSLVYSDGQTYVAADEVRFVRVTELVLLNIGWRVTDTGFGQGAKTQCDV